MATSRIQAVFFDAAGTLFHVKGTVGEVYLRYAETYGVPNSEEMVAKVDLGFKEAFRQATPPIFVVDQPEKLKQLERLWWFDIVHAVFYRVGMFEGFDDYFDEVFDAFGTAKLWEVYPEVPGVLQKLKSEGFELGVISNFDTRFYAIFRGLGLDQYFDSITISSMAGSAKPGQKIFQYALDQHAIDPEEAAHVGDSITEDVEGANKAKLTGIFLDRKHMASAVPALTIHSLDSLPSLLQSI